MHSEFLSLHPFRTRRFVFAVVASIALHGWLGAFLRGGPGARIASVHATPEITATIETRRASVATDSAPVNPGAVGIPPQTTAERSQALRPPAQTAASQPQAQPPNEAAAPGSADPTYYGVRQLDVFPTPIAPIDIPYPMHAGAAAVAGRVSLLVLVSDTGRVDEISVVEADPAGVFEEQARRIFTNVQFSPAQRGGRRVRARLIVEVNFGAR